MPEHPVYCILPMSEIQLFVYDIPPGTKTESLPYLQKALAAYCACKGWDQEAFRQIRKDEKGRPFVEGEPLFVSATHSGGRVICAVCRERVGIDAEFPCLRGRTADYQGIAARFFSPLEQAYVKERGEEGFFEIWVRKEAYMKYTGKGMAYGFRRIPTRDEKGFVKQIRGCRMRFERCGEMFFACAGGTGALRWNNKSQR